MKAQWCDKRTGNPLPRPHNPLGCPQLPCGGCFGDGIWIYPRADKAAQKAAQDAVDDRLESALSFIRPRLIDQHRKTGVVKPTEFDDFSDLQTAFHLAMVSRSQGDRRRGGVRHPNTEKHWRSLAHALAAAFVQAQLWSRPRGGK